MRCPCCSSTTPSGCSSIERAGPARPSWSPTRTLRPSLRSAAGSTASRSPSSWRPRAAGRCRRSESPQSSTTGSICSPVVPARCFPGSRRSRPRSTGATTGWTRPSRCSSVGSECSPGASRWTAAEHVAAAIGDLDPVTVFDVVSRLVDKSLVLIEERPGGEQHYRLLETLRAYAIERARAAGELGPLRDAQVSFWLGWLERHEPIVHTDAVIEHLELFHDSVAAALEWSTGDPAVGLRLLRLLGRAWHGGGRPQAALTAVDRLLTDENAERFPLRVGRRRSVGGRPCRHRSELARSGRAFAAWAGSRRRSRRRLPRRGQRHAARIHGGQLRPSSETRARARAAVRRVRRHDGSGFGRARSGSAALRGRCSTTRTFGPLLVRAGTCVTGPTGPRVGPRSISVISSSASSSLGACARARLYGWPSRR